MQPIENAGVGKDTPSSLNPIGCHLAPSSPHRIEHIGDATLYLADCRELLSELRADVLVTDPPYGIGEARGKNASRSKPFAGGGKTIAARNYGVAVWDDRPIEQATLDLARGAARWSIIFGGNFYLLPPARCWLVWDKLNGDSDFADCELAWTNLPRAVRRIRHMWNGMLRKNNEPRGFHPTQKPIAVMQWCIQLAPDADSVIDPFMGSGTTGIAALRLGRKFIGIEIEPHYFDVACWRIEQEVRQLRFAFDVPPRDVPQQRVLL